MSRHYGGAPAPRGGGGWRRRALRPAGSLAWFDGICARCDQPITRLASQVVKHREDWIHVGCAAGSDDE